MERATKNIADRIREAGAHRRRLRIRGAGSKDFLGGPLRGDLLDTGELTGIRSYEPSELVVTVGAGTRLTELEATLASKGQYLPFEPPHFGSAGNSESMATCGGMLASGLAGPSRATVGGVRDYVLGLTMLNGRGETLVFGGQVMKNVAGYDLSRIMTGSMGALGVVLEMSLKVLPWPQADATLEFELEQSRALTALHEWIARALPIQASCWVEDAGRQLLFVRLRGARAAVDSACRIMGGQRVDPAVARSDWLACRDHRLPFFTSPSSAHLDLWRLSVPPACAPLPTAEPQLIEWHGGQRWLWSAPGAGERLQTLAAKAGGHASMFRCGSQAHKPINAFAALSTPSARVQRELKRMFDPAGVFCGERLHPELDDQHAN